MTQGRDFVPPAIPDSRYLIHEARHGRTLSESQFARATNPKNCRGDQVSKEEQAMGPMTPFLILGEWGGERMELKSSATCYTDTATTSFSSAGGGGMRRHAHRRVISRDDLSMDILAHNAKIRALPRGKEATLKRLQQDMAAMYQQGRSRSPHAHTFIPRSDEMECDKGGGVEKKQDAVGLELPRRSTFECALGERAYSSAFSRRIELTAAPEADHDKASNPRTKDVAAKARNAHEPVGEVDEHGHSQNLQLPPLVRLESSCGSPTARSSSLEGGGKRPSGTPLKAWQGTPNLNPKPYTFNIDL